MLKNFLMASTRLAIKTKLLTTAYKDLSNQVFGYPSALLSHCILPFSLIPISLGFLLFLKHVSVFIALGLHVSHCPSCHSVSA